MSDVQDLDAKLAENPDFFSERQMADRIAELEADCAKRSQLASDLAAENAKLKRDAHRTIPISDLRMEYERMKDALRDAEAENARLKDEHDDMVRIRERMYQRDCQHRAALLKAEDILGFYATGGHDQGGYAEEALAEIRTAKGQL